MNVQFLKTNMPIFLYATFYSLFTLIGITFFLFDNNLYISLYEIFSGVSRPVLTTLEQYRDLFLIAYISPLIFITFFYFSFKYKRLNKFFGKLNIFLNTINIKTAFSLYALMCMFLFFKILSLVKLDDILFCYTNHFTMINARFFLFKNFKFLDWVLFYSWVPVITGILYYKINSNILRRSIVCFSMFLLLYTMQKRYILILLFFIFFIDFFRTNNLTKSFFKNICIILIILAFVFTMQTFLQKFITTESILFEEKSSVIHSTYNNIIINDKNQKYFNANKCLNTEITFHKNLIGTVREFKNHRYEISQKDFNLIRETMTNAEWNLRYYLNSFLNRTSIPSIYYIELFPYKRDFLNFGIDSFFSLREADNEGKILWAYLNGDFASEEGASAAAFNFSLYAHVGVYGTLLISALLGILLGICWSIIQSFESMLPRTIFSSMFCIFMIFLTMDNFKTSSFSTAYAIGWWVLCYMIVCALSNYLSLLKCRFITKS